MKDISNLSLEELLNILPPSLELPQYKIDHLTGRITKLPPVYFELHFRKIAPDQFGSNKLKKQFKEGAWELSYQYNYFESNKSYPPRLYEGTDLIDLEDLPRVNSDDFWVLSGGVLNTDLKQATIILIEWLERNNICQV